MQSFPVPINHVICECRAAGRVEELWFDIQIGEHVDRRYAGTLVAASSDPGTVTNPVGSAARSRRARCCSSVSVINHLLPLASGVVITNACATTEGPNNGHRFASPING
jgi:hypothetical protein